MIKVENLCKSFRTEDVETIALTHIAAAFGEKLKDS